MLQQFSTVHLELFKSMASVVHQHIMHAPSLTQRCRVCGAPVVLLSTGQQGPVQQQQQEPFSQHQERNSSSMVKQAKL